MKVLGWVAVAVGAGALVVAGTVLLIESPWDRTEDPVAFLVSDPAAQAALDAYLDGRQRHLDLKEKDSGNPVEKWDSYSVDEIMVSDLDGLTTEDAVLSSTPKKLELTDDGGFVLTDYIYLDWTEVEENGERVEAGAGDEYVLTFESRPGGYELVSEETILPPPANE